ncbi:DUF4147 domain-containing protein [bacterium]|nr:DUF4147 domain-containing protein [bacterium]
MFNSAKGYVEFLSSLSFDFSDFENIREKDGFAVISIGKSACYMYKHFVGSFPEAALFPYFAVMPEGSDAEGLESENIFFSTHPHLSEKSFEACNRLINFINFYKPKNVAVLLSGGSSALVEKSENPENSIKLNEKLLKSGLPITEINRIRSENSLVKNGKFAEMFAEIDWYVFVASDIPYPKGEFFVGSMPFYRENLANTRLFKCADSDLPHDALLKQLPDNTLSFRHFTGTLDELKDLVLCNIGNSGCILVSGEPLLKINSEKAGTGGRMSHFALMMLPYIKKGMRLYALSSDGIDGNSPFAGAVVDGGDFSAFENERIEALKNYNSAELLNKLGFMLKSGYTGINLNDFVVLLKI